MGYYSEFFASRPRQVLNQLSFTTGSNIDPALLDNSLVIDQNGSHIETPQGVTDLGPALLENKGVAAYLPPETDIGKMWFINMETGARVFTFSRLSACSMTNCSDIDNVRPMTVQEVQMYT